MKEVRKVYSIQELEEAASLLEKDGIIFRAKENILLHENPYTSNPTDKNYTIVVNETDVQKTLELFNNYYNEGHNTDESFLYQFEDIDLAEILVYPQKYAASEEQEAKAILLSRGLSKEEIEQKKDEIITNDNTPAKVKGFGLVLGYGSALIGGVFGIVMGLFLIFAKTKHTITGEKYYAHDSDNRMDGLFMILLSIVVIVVLFWVFS